MSTGPGRIQVPVGPLVAALGALILLISLFLDWYAGITGFTVFEFVDIVLLGCALLTIASLAGGMGLVRPPVSSGVSLAVAVFTVVVVLVQIVNDPPAVVGPNGADREIGIWLALGGTALMVAGAVFASAHISLAIEPRRTGSPSAPRGADPPAGSGERPSEAPARSQSSPGKRS